jgi:thioredoxin 1
MDDLQEIRNKKLKALQNQYLKGAQNMEKDMPNAPIKVTDADIETTVKKYETIVVDCWAPWCGPCRMLGPIIDELAKEMHGKIVFAKLNVDENQATSAKHSIMSIPTMLIFKNGQLKDKVIGAMPKDILKQKLLTY